MRCTGVSILVVVIALVGVARADGPQTADQKRADALFTEGRKLIDAHDDAGACAKFNEAIKLDPDAAGTMLNLGLCNQNLKKYRTALYWFRKAQFRAHESGLPEYEKAAGERTTALVALVATVKIVFTGTPPGDAKVKIDGEELKSDDFAHAEVDTGHHSLDAGAPGHKSVHQEFDVEGKGGQTLTLELVAGDNSVIIDRGAGRRRTALYTAIGGGVLLAASGVISFYAKYKYDRCLDGAATPPTKCVNDPTKNGVDEANHYHNLARYGATPPFAIGVLAVAIGGYLYFTAPQRERIDRTVFVPAISPDQLGIAALGHF
jgi:tetratricopeptide (TPR) repeat protein